MIPRQTPRLAFDVATGAGSFGNHLDVPVCGVLVESWRMPVPSSGGARRALSDDRWLADSPCRVGAAGIVLRAYDRLLVWR
jgi:hypothetical protein